MSRFTILDIGSSKIAGLIAQVSGSQIKILASGVCASVGFKSGSVISMQDAEDSILKTVTMLEKQSKSVIKDVYVSICSSATESSYIKGSIRIIGQQIIKSDVQRLVEKTIESFYGHGLSVLHYFPMDFTLDGQAGITDPIGMIGKELGRNLHVITIKSNMLANLINCFTKCNINVKEVVLGSYASGLACITDDEKESGTLVLDLGHYTTSFGVFLKKKLFYTGHIPIGGWHITSDISKAFGISMRSAEKIKNLYASATHLQTSEAIKLSEIDSSEFVEKSQVIYASDLCWVVAARATEIFELLKAEYSKLRIDDLVTPNMVITGGWSALRNIEDLVSELFDREVRKGNIINPCAFDGKYCGDQYATTFGILQHIMSSSQEVSLHNRHKISKIWKWIKENI